MTTPTTPEPTEAEKTAIIAISEADTSQWNPAVALLRAHVAEQTAELVRVKDRACAAALENKTEADALAAQLAEKDAEIEQWKDCHRVMQQSAVLQAKLKDDARAERDALAAQVRKRHKNLSDVMGCLREGWIPASVYADAKDALAAMKGTRE